MCANGAVWIKTECVALLNKQNLQRKKARKQTVIKFCAKKTLVLDLMLVTPAGCLWNCSLVELFRYVKCEEDFFVCKIQSEHL